MDNPSNLPAPGPSASAAFEQLVDHLAERGYALLDHFITPETCAEIRALIDRKEEEGKLKKAGIGSGHDFQVNRNIRGDLIQWIEPEKAAAATQLYLEKLHEMMAYINRTLYLGLKNSELHYTVYPPGKFYQRHLDQFRLNDHRRLSVICYLNEQWLPEHGGALRLYLPKENSTEEQQDVLPMAGRLICFRSDLLEHEVLPATRHRYSVTGWLLDKI